MGRFPAVLFAFLLACSVFCQTHQFAPRSPRSVSVAVRSVSVRGTLKCGSSPSEGAVVRLFRVPFGGESQVLDKRTTGPSGMFEISTNTNGRPVNETELNPAVKIYHRCGDEENKKAYRRFQLSIPDDYVSLGRVAKRTYDIGELNLEIVYPKEAKEKDFKDT